MRRAHRPVGAVIFDLDGTLMDHHAAATVGVGVLAAGYGAVLSPELTTAWFVAEERHFASWRAGEISYLEQRRRRIREFLPQIGVETGDDDWCDAAFEGFRLAYERAWAPFPDAREAVELVVATGVRTAVLTNGGEQQQNAKVDAIGMRDLLGPVFTAEGLGTPKPDPRAYREVCAALGTAPSDTLHVGDHYDLDVRAPREAGLQAVFLDRAGSGPTDPGMIGTLLELPERLRTASR